MATATATAQAQAQPAMDAREWDEAAYRRGILRERDLSCRTLFRAVFFDQRDDPDPDVLLAAASSDGSLASFSLSSCISSSAPTHAAPQVNTSSSICPVLSVGAMGLATKGTLKMGNLQRDSFVATAAGMMAAFGAGDGTRCRAALCRSLCKGIIWNQYLTWLTLSMKVLGVPALQYRKIMPLQLANRMDLFLQQLVMHVLIAGMWYVFSEESGKCKMTFKGHTDYLHSIAVREANHQIAEVGSVHRRYIQYRTRNLRARGLVALPLMRVKVGWPVVLLVVYQFGVFFQMSASLTQIVVLLFKICCLIKIKWQLLPDMEVWWMSSRHLGAICAHSVAGAWISN
ncbi:uncharacterized protein LOC100825336 isoform X9 [Brachypodium distachyon]|uniref:uncharacterized protein LOC100825336 isoform X9 n=1 Tax=Brachypodium distachyon TaxID=15368 RepID=UPI000D0DCDF4|nr:uncharacterized protein LOC100825336 isoform X9 [Brachypodium distachyon]|eukprot:XP_024319267.1 uncharacterized protein LOC100825336 isoform X9 [Brachypodium distachyon]